MSFSLEVTNLSSEQISFGYSAAHETLIALHVLIDCKHHPLHIPWVINARKKVNPALKQEIDAFSIFYKRPIVTFWGLQENSTISDFGEDLNKLSCGSSDAFFQTVAETILGPKKTNQQQEFVQLACSRYPESKEIILALLEKPEQVKQRFLTFLEDFWKSCLKDDWSRIEELFLKDIASRGRKLMKDGPLQLLGSLSPEIDIHPNQKKAVIRRISKREICFEKDDVLLLAPSYFAWPHLFVSTHTPVGINYSIMENQQEAARPMPPEDLLKLFNALGDLSRLQIVKYLSQKPRSTRELAGLMGMTEGAVSKHIKLLKDVGLIASERKSYYVFYHLLEKSFSQIQSGLAQYIKGTEFMI
ncbi:ArsR/SmtB family transcription factor [Neobacillus rhizophilus]|uniref:Winged helix-turn-helix transcriptional regulator n=1 Tax=Neobacillus rhizophilus TaxID=2833579 RepID=A0A942U891_9BACI|nr:DUF5937 family protein [Neobacillus rhizophilus]MBS4214433.1 winged helix-turn-helix transcriptional regulator [Neobacillus rhizophilus]